MCVCNGLCVLCLLAGHYLYSANLPPCDYCGWLPFWLLLSRFARLYSFPSLSVSVSLSLSLSLAPSLTLCHTLSFCWWHSSCTFALASCAPQTVLHFIVYCGCPTRLAPCLCLPGIPRRGIVRRQLRLWLLLTQPFYNCSLLHCAALSTSLPPSLYSSLFVPL